MPQPTATNKKKEVVRFIVRILTNSDARTNHLHYLLAQQVLKALVMPDSDLPMIERNFSSHLSQFASALHLMASSTSPLGPTKAEYYI